MLNYNYFNPNKIVLAVVLVLGLGLAVVVGDSVASGQYAYIGIAVLVLFVMPLGLKLGTSYWILIAFSMTANARLGFVPLPFTLHDFCTIAAAMLFMVHIVMRRVELKVPLHLPDILVLLNVAWLVVTFVKNPTGFFFLGSDTVGGRKYIDIAFAFVGYFILTRCRIPFKWAYLLPIWLGFSFAAPNALQTLATISPELGAVINRFYNVSLQSEAGALANQGAMGMEERVSGLEKTALPLFLVMCAYYAPVTLFTPLYPLRMLGFVVASILVGLSGFRSYIIAMVGYIAVSTWLRGRLRDFLPITAVGIMTIIALAGAVQSGQAIPLTIQRALSVLPLGWDSRAVAAAEESTTWRVDMWRDAWNDPNYFRDKVFGDGFGFTHQELLLFANEMAGLQGLTGVSNTYEMFIIRGSLHNGPLSSIRYGGFVGLFFLTSLMIVTAIYAVKVVRSSSGTVYAPIAFFTAIPLIYEPFAFFAIFGAYDNNMIQYFLGVGMLNLINRSLPHPVGTASPSITLTDAPSTESSSPAIPASADRLR